MTLSIATLSDEIRQHAQASLGAVASLYQDLHRMPELSFQEHETGARLARELQQLGYEVSAQVGGTGVVALLRNGEGPTVMLRSDTDALPIQELTGLDFASQVTARTARGDTVPVMHACGHDLHSSCLVGAADVLMRMRERWRGTVMWVCQPAEELFGGARAMLDDGLYERFARPDVVLGQHNMPARAGTVGHNGGLAMAAATTLGVTVHGAGGHGSMPERAIDPVVIAAHIVTRLQTIVSREVSPREPVVVTVGKLHAGTQGNVIPDRAELEINVRSFDNAVHQQVLASIRRIVQAECDAGRSPRAPDFEVLSDTITLQNDAQATQQVQAAHAQFFGPDHIFAMPTLSGSEDFPYFGHAEAGGFGGPDIPYVYWFIGSIGQQQWEALPGADREEKIKHAYWPHSPYYAPGNPETMETGVGAFVTGALSFLAAP